MNDTERSRATSIPAFRERLKHQIILMDGAMGTYYERLYPGEREAEYASLTHPDRIAAIHRAYIDAGAEVIRTNTFAVNHMLFDEDKIEPVLTAACRQAERAVEESGRPVMIAGSIGPIRQESEDDEMRVMTEYHRIANILLAQGIRYFVLETFSEAEVPAEVAKFIRLQSRVLGEDVFIQVQFTLNRVGYTQFGHGIRKLAEEMAANPYIDCVGFNCGIGGTHMYKLLADMEFGQELTLSVLPNAGYAHNLRGHQIFGEQPAYFCSMMEKIIGLGANLVGGCCGTSPEHIAALRRVVDADPEPRAKRLRAQRGEEMQSAGPLPEQMRNAQPELPRNKGFREKLRDGEMVYIAEIDAPFDHRAERFLAAGRTLQENGIDLVTISDSPMARARADAVQMGTLLGRETGIEPMPHICGRDRNIIGLRAEILGAYINGIRSLLLITGDPVGREDRNIITSVFDVNSIRLMEYVRHMNEELFADDPICFGGALNYAGANPDGIARRMRQKAEAGCSFFLTQPVYAEEDMERVYQLRKMTGAKILIGIMPLVSHRNALFMQNEMPGIHVPEEIVRRYRPDMTREEAEETAVEISLEIGRRVADWADGYYFMTPFNRAALISRIIRALRKSPE